MFSRLTARILRCMHAQMHGTRPCVRRERRFAKRRIKLSYKSSSIKIVRKMRFLVVCLVLGCALADDCNLRIVPGACDIATKVCTAHPMNCGTLNSIDLFLSASTPNNPFDDGWTLKISPCSTSCNASTCTVEFDDCPEGTELYEWEMPSAYVRFNNIVITSLSRVHPVKIKAAAQAADANAPIRGQDYHKFVCSFFIVMGSGVILQNMEFRVDSACEETAAIYDDLITSTTPIIFVGPDVSNSAVINVTTEACRGIVKAFPMQGSSTINMDGVQLGPGLSITDMVDDMFGVSVTARLSMYTGNITLVESDEYVIVHMQGSIDETGITSDGNYTNLNMTIQLSAGPGAYLCNNCDSQEKKKDGSYTAVVVTLGVISGATLIAVIVYAVEHASKKTSEHLDKISDNHNAEQEEDTPVDQPPPPAAPVAAKAVTTQLRPLYSNNVRQRPPSKT